MRAFNCNGVWWLPESPSDRVAGTLRFSDDGFVELSLMGTLGESTASLEGRTVPVILGLVWDCPLGREVTLKDCLLKSLHSGSRVPPREEYFAGRMFGGSHFKKQEDFSFSEISIVLSGLSSWADTLSGLSRGKESLTDFEVRYRQPEPISGRIPGGDLTLGVEATLSMSRRNYSITEEVHFKIACDQPQPIEGLNARYVYPLQNLMTLATDQPNALVDFRVRGLNNRDDIHVLGKRSFFDARPATDLFPHEMIFSLEDVRDRVVPLISKWIEISERLADVCEPYFGVQYVKAFVENRFLTVFLALEVYRRRRGQTDEHAISSQGPPLSEQLTQLLEEHAATVGPLFGGDTARAVAELMRYRNHIVHGDPAPPGERTNNNREFWLTQKLMFLMKACLLTELGFPVEDQVKFFHRSQLYINILSLPKD
jgi:hypothetical protein